jgi:hypothetical protein
MGFSSRADIILLPRLRKALNVVGNMKKPLLFTTALTILISCKTAIETFQTSDANKIGIKSNKFRGTLFTNSYQADKLFIDGVGSLNRFTPTKEDIALAESILKEQIREANKSRINQLSKRQHIDKNLNKYFRQYVGFIDKNGERTIHINFHWDRFTLMDRVKGNWDDRLNYTSDYSIVFDGGSRYWSANVNLTSKKLYGLSVNGIA